MNREAFAAARTVAGHFASKGGVFVTVQDTGGDFGLSGAGGVRAWLGGIGALAKTAAEEWPLALVRAIDLERGGRNDGAVADALVAELLHGGIEKEVGLAKDGARVALASVPASPPSAGRPIEPGTLFVVSGGARGVTAAALIALARASRPRFVLLGRTPLEDEPAEFRGVSGDADLKRVAFARAKTAGAAGTPQTISATVERVVAAREIRETLEKLAAAGSEARYVTADVRDSAALIRILEGIRREWGPIRGLVHGAGVLSDALLGKKTDAQFDRVFDTKVLGLRGLLDATREDPIAWMCLFSSVAARSGNAGQADYAMANEVLNKVAAAEARRRGDACRVVSIGWGPWEGGMVTPSLHKHFELRGVKLLPVAVGAAAFVAELSGRGDVDVVIGSNTDVSSGPAATQPRFDRGQILQSARCGLARERDGRFVSDLFPPIAIVGQGCVLPGTLTPEGLWSLVEGGRSAISRVPEELWRLAPSADREALARAIASDVGGYVSGFDEVFDAGGFLIAPEDLAGLDPVFLLTLHAAREALRSAGMEIGVPYERGTVVLGNLGYPTPGLVEFALEVWGEGPRTVDARNRFQSGLPPQLVARGLGFRGGFAVDAACASSLYAIKLACDALHDGRVDIALAGGVNHADDLFLHLGFTAL